MKESLSVVAIKIGAVTGNPLQTVQNESINSLNNVSDKTGHLLSHLKLYCPTPGSATELKQGAEALENNTL